MADPFVLADTPLHLAHGRLVPQPRFTGEMDWYMAYDGRHGADGPTGMLVTQHRFTADWDSWEMHPEGDEMVMCLDGAITLHQELVDGTRATVTLTAGQFAINPPGCWHTADVATSATCLFITCGTGTEGRPR